MNAKQICCFFFAISVASLVYGNPMKKRDVSTTFPSSVQPTANYADWDTSNGTGKDTIEEDIVIHRYEDEKTGPHIQDPNKTATDWTEKKATPGQQIVIRAHEEDEIVPSENGVPQGSILYRDLDEVLIEPIGVEYELESDDDDLETAATLVFRPYFRYSKKTVRRYPSTRRRTSRPRRPLYY